MFALLMDSRWDPHRGMYYSFKLVNTLPVPPDSKWDPDRQIYFYNKSVTSADDTSHGTSADDTSHGIQGTNETPIVLNASVEDSSKSTLQSCMSPSKKLKRCDENPVFKAPSPGQRIQIDYLHDAEATTPLRSNTNKEKMHQLRCTQMEELRDSRKPDPVAYSTNASAPQIRNTENATMTKRSSIEPENSDTVTQHVGEANKEKMSKPGRPQPVKPNLASKKRPADKDIEQYVDERTPVPGGELQRRNIPAAHASPWVPAPVVLVDRLTYDWSSLKLDGTVAWSAWKDEWLFQNAVTLAHTEPSTAAMDMFRFVTALKEEVFQTLGPAPASPLVKTLTLMSSWRLWNRQGDRRFKKAKTVVEEPDATNDWVERCTSLLTPLIPSFCKDEDLGPLIPRAAAVYYEMFSQQGSTTQRRNERIKKYQYMTAEELQEYVKEVERDVTVTLVEKERRIMRTAERLRLYPLETLDRVSVARDPSPRVLPQDDFSYLFKQVPSRRKRKRYMA
jgi:hypothetical protein